MNSFRKMKLKLSKREEDVCVENEVNSPNAEEKRCNLADYGVTTPPPSPPCNSPAKRIRSNDSARKNTLKPQHLFEKEICDILPTTRADKKNYHRSPDTNQRPFISPITTDEEIEPSKSPNSLDSSIGNATNLRFSDIAPLTEDERKVDIFQCKFCERSFSYLCHLKVHERVHTGEKPYSCKFCSMPFSQLGSLTVHMRIHTGEKPYQCKVCAKNFRHINSLRRHQRQVHAGQTFSPVKVSSYDQLCYADKQLGKEKTPSKKSPHKLPPLTRQFNLDNRSAINIAGIHFTKQTQPKQKSIFTSIDRIIGDSDDSKKSKNNISQNLSYFSQTYQNVFAIKEHFQMYGGFVPKYVPYIPHLQSKTLQYFSIKSQDEGYSCPSVENDKLPLTTKQAIDLKYSPHKKFLFSDYINSRKWSEDSGIY